MDLHQYVLRGKVIHQMTDDEFYQFCTDNPELRLERNEHQEIIIMSPTGTTSGFNSSECFGQLYLWNKQTKLGKTFDSSTGFLLPDGSVRSPDAAWVSNTQWKQLTAEQKKKFAPLCPVFVIEVKSESDNLTDLQKKMQMWISNGCLLAFLIDPELKQSFIYAKNTAVEQIRGFDKQLSGGTVLPGFELDLSELEEV
ncbi:Uma2 family endonuclease [Catalinimonas niigatensis]|uniref:Uma2 family endonuclease n=1 Tax=Catalinimonas niigatensis TaxID=1397264 RepID=UPI002666A338|nr:Uma2 family endonuclease [Catalinimonas niigatensis]WPP50375.1 Uma2 family endonuclease [Catalinimonas niigatensis]